MKYALISKAQRWGWSLLPCLLLVSERCSAQFVEASFQIEGTSWPRSSSGERTEHRRIYGARCIFGTNIWLPQRKPYRRSRLGDRPDFLHGRRYRTRRRRNLLSATAGRLAAFECANSPTPAAPDRGSGTFAIIIQPVVFGSIPLRTVRAFF